MTKWIVMLIVVVATTACNKMNVENTRLLAENDSLKNQIENDKIVADKLFAITQLIDEIEVDRLGLSVNLETGMDPADYEQKVKSIQQSIKVASEKISSLSKSNNTYASMIKKYEKQIQAKAKEIMELNSLVSQYKEQNEGLISKVDLQNIEIEDKSTLIEIKEQELYLIEAKVQELVKQAELSEAEAYFAKGEAYYLAASRTKLAPKKRQETLKEALGLYEQAEKLGVSEASSKIKEIKDQIN